MAPAVPAQPATVHDRTHAYVDGPQVSAPPMPDSGEIAPTERSPRRVTWLILAALLLLSACAAAVAVIARDNAEAPASGALQGSGLLHVEPAHEGTTDLVDLTAMVTHGEVVPGQQGVLSVVAENPSDVAVALGTVSVTVGRPSQPRCLAEWLTVGRYPAHGEAPALVPAHGSTTIELPFEFVNLPDVNQDACKGATFPLTITGIGGPA